MPFDPPAGARPRATLGAMNSDLPEYLDRLAQIQRGVLSAPQAISGGISRDMIRSLVRTGRWRPLHYGVYATFTGEPGRDAVLWAAVLRAGTWCAAQPQQRLSSTGSSTGPSPAIHVTIPGQRRIAAMPGIVVHIAVRRRAGGASDATCRLARKIEETVLDLA